MKRRGRALPIVRFEPSGREVVAREGTTLFSAARRAKLPVGASCDALGVCGACGLVVLAGAEHLSPETPTETRTKAANRLGDVRLSCVTTVHGDVTVTARYW